MAAQQHPRPRIGDTVPDFTANSSQGPIHLYDYAKNSWCMLFSHPRDKTPVCTTELGALFKMMNEFTALNTKVIGLSCDRVEEHHEWSKDICDVAGMTGGKDNSLPFPIIADADRKIAELYGMITNDPNAKDSNNLPLTVRSVFLIDPQHKLRLEMTYPSTTGRNWAEIIRCLKALHTADTHHVATPCCWQPGDKVIAPHSMSTEEVRKKFGDDVQEVKPYLRYVHVPNEFGGGCGACAGGGAQQVAGGNQPMPAMAQQQQQQQQQKSMAHAAGAAPAAQAHVGPRQRV